jgi:archaellum component FlaC
MSNNGGGLAAIHPRDCQYHRGAVDNLQDEMRRAQVSLERIERQLSETVPERMEMLEKRIQQIENVCSEILSAVHSLRKYMRQEARVDSTPSTPCTPCTPIEEI